MNRRKLLLSIMFFVLLIGIVGFDLAQIQAGLETPSDAVLASATAESQTVDPPPLITTYERFSVPVEGDISVDVHMRESAGATANIFMVHGAGGGAWAWEEYFEQLPEKYNLYAISWRGHFTSSPVEDANAADYVRDQIAAIEAISGRNNLPIHVTGHSYGGATSILATAQRVDQIASLHLIAPVVPIDFSFLQAQIIPMILPPIIRNSPHADENEDSAGPYANMFLDQEQMDRYWDLYAGQSYSIEKPGLIAGDGLSPEWQATLDAGYQTIGESDLPVWFLIARYDNVVVPERQRTTAAEIGASYIELESGHYIQLDVMADESIGMVLANLESLDG